MGAPSGEDPRSVAMGAQPTFYWVRREDAILLEDMNEAGRTLAEGAFTRFKGRAAKDFLSHRPDILGDLDQCLKTRDSLSRRVTISIRGGQTRMVSYYLVFGGPGRVIMLVRDVTEETHLKRALADSEARLRAMFENSMIGILRTRLESGEVVDANEAMAEIMGFGGVEEVLAQKKVEGYYLEPDQGARIMEMLRQQGHVKNLEVSVRRKDGAGAHLLVNAYLSQRDGYLDAMVMDITKAVQARRALALSEVKYRHIFENALTGIYRLNAASGQVLEANQAAAEIFGYESTQQLKEEFSTLAKHVSKQDRAAFYRRLKASGRVDNFEIEIKRRDGSAAHVILQGGFHHGRELVEGVVVDITKRKQMEEALAASEKMLKTLSAQLLYAHESERQAIARELHDSIGQSLVAIKFGVETAMDLMDEAPLKARGSLGSVVRLIQNVSQEVRRMQKTLRPAALDDIGLIAAMDQLCREFMDIYTDIGCEKKIGIKESDVPDELKIVIFRIVQEAMNNAVKHSKATRFGVALTAGADGLSLKITDNGQGLELARMERRGKPSGHGLGLMSMRERAQLSGGRLEIKSAPGQGVLIQAVWPLAGRG